MKIIINGVQGNAEVYLDVMRALCGSTDGKSMIDLGCNHAPYTPQLGFKERTYVDIIDRKLDDEKEQQYFVKSDMLKFIDTDKRYDTAISSDSIEHLHKKDGYHLIRLMEKCSDRQIIFTPLNDWMMDLEGTDPEGHHSLWTPEMLPKYISVVFPDYHTALNIGAWFGLKCDDLDKEFYRICQELKTKSWYDENKVEIFGNKKIAGTLFVRNAIEFDYCVEAAIKSLQIFCDRIYVVDAGSTDGTFELLKTTVDDKTFILRCAQEKWHEVQGKEKLAFFTNIAIEQAQSDGYEYQFNLQADEILHPDSIPFIKQATGLNEEGFFVTRYNLWASDKTMLNVPQSRKPCSTQICRLTKTQYRSVGDAESVSAPASLDYINKIEIFHMGFIRNPKKHIAKIKEIQGNIFKMDYDKRADLKEEFDWRDWGFTEKDLIPVPKPIPSYLEKLLNK